MTIPATSTPPATPTAVHRSPGARLRPVDLRTVHLTDAYWAPRRRLAETDVLASQYRRCEDVGAIDNFRRAAGCLDGDFAGMFYADSDVYKWLEAVSWALVRDPDHPLGPTVDSLVELIEAAQLPDGYLNTYFTGARAAERWTNLRHRHEIYCAGHLIQAAVAHHATGSRRLLGVAVRLADHMDRLFGPEGRLAACGHPEAEMALVELYRVTGELRYLRLARRMVDARGQEPSTITGTEPTYGDDHWAIQDHLPFVRQREMTGHAVRALYLYGGAADLLLEGEGPDLADTLHAAWRDLQGRKVYLTGGAGSRWHYESLGQAYELPNERAYTETCAAIATVQLAWRLLLHTGGGEYRDALERALYNAVACGMSLDGESYFYQNPLADRGGHRRSPWFHTACCPPNIARTLTSLPSYAWTTDDAGGVWMHLLTAGNATLPAGEGEAEFTVSTDYPWDGTVTVRVAPDAPREFTLRLPVPRWCGEWSLTVAGAPADVEEHDGYLALARTWQPGDTVVLDLTMPVRLTRAHPRVLADQGRVALERGPLVYCLESADNTADVWDVTLDGAGSWTPVFEPGLLGGTVVLEGTAHVSDAPAAPGDDGATEPLYAPFSAAGAGPRPEVAVRAVPYALWANRDAGPMIVWVGLS